MALGSAFFGSRVRCSDELRWSGFGLEWFANPSNHTRAVTGALGIGQLPNDERLFGSAPRS